jgi:hypothetical protein
MLKPATALAIAAVAHIGSAPAALASEDKPHIPVKCMKTDIQATRASFDVNRTSKALKKAKTPKAKAAARKKLAAARKRHAKLKRQLTKCISDNQLTVDKTTVGALEGLLVTVSVPDPPVGQHYRVTIYAGIPNEGDPNYLSCSLVGRHDWVSPNGYVSGVPDGASGWCPGSGSVSLQLVPDGAPERYTGKPIARKSITFTA